MNLLRGARGCFTGRPRPALMRLRKAPVVASDGNESASRTPAATIGCSAERMRPCTLSPRAGRRSWSARRWPGTGRRCGHPAGTRFSGGTASVSRPAWRTSPARWPTRSRRETTCSPCDASGWLHKSFGLAGWLTELGGLDPGAQAARIGAGPRRHPERFREVRSGPCVPDPHAGRAQPTPDLHVPPGEVAATNNAASAICGQRWSGAR